MRPLKTDYVRVYVRLSMYLVFVYVSFYVPIYLYIILLYTRY